MDLDPHATKEKGMIPVPITRIAKEGFGDQRTERNVYGKLVCRRMFPRNVSDRNQSIFSGAYHVED